MKKMLLKSALAAVVGVGMMAGSASALPWDSLGSEWVVSTAQDYWTPTDLTTSVDGNSFFQIEVEQAAFESNFGLYIIDETTGLLKDTFEIFNKSEEPLTKETITFWDDNGVFKVADDYNATTNTATWKTFDSEFGFYYDIYTGGVNDTSIDYSFFTDATLNTADVGVEHITTAYNASDKQLYIYLEDLVVNPDWDWTDMTVFADDVQPVPEPATMLLFGTGLAGLAGYSRRRKK